MSEREARLLDISITCAVEAMVKALGMHWENEARKVKGESLAYSEKEFVELLEAGCNWNEAIGRWR